MRSTTTVSALILALLATADGLASSKVPQKIDLNVHVRRASNHEIHYDVCGPYDGCTHFVAPALTAGCTAREGSWNLEPAARVMAFVYVIDMSLLSHEYVHIKDIQDGIGAHLRALERRTFGSEEACSDASRRAAVQFRETIRQLAGHSMTRRH